MVLVFFITQGYGCLCFHLGAATCSSFLQSVSAWVLWGRAPAAEPLPIHHTANKASNSNLLLLLATSRAAWPSLCRGVIYTGV